MKLKLEHIAPYLPYGIKVTYVQRLFGGEKIVKHYSQSIDRIFMDYGFIQLHTEPYSKQDPLNSYLLELRPLSDLTKEIEHNGEKFVPIDFFDDEYIRNWIYKLSITKDTEWALSYLGFYQVQKLIEWHFDIYGLIDKDLAVDINTL